MASFRFVRANAEAVFSPSCLSEASQKTAVAASNVLPAFKSADTCWSKRKRSEIEIGVRGKYFLIAIDLRASDLYQQVERAKPRRRQALRRLMPCLSSS